MWKLKSCWNSLWQERLCCIDKGLSSQTLVEKRCLLISVGVNIKMPGHSLKHISNIYIEETSQSSATNSELNWEKVEWYCFICFFPCFYTTLFLWKMAITPNSEHQILIGIDEYLPHARYLVNKSMKWVLPSLFYKWAIEA